MIRRRPNRRAWGAPSRSAAGGLLLSLAVLGWSAVGSGRIEPLPDPTANASVPIGPTSGDSTPARDVDQDVVSAAVEANPFSPDRRPPAVRFTLSDRADEEWEHADHGSAPAGLRPELIGIARAGANAFVLVSYPGEESRIVRPGESIGGWRLESVSNDVAVFRSEAGERVELAMPRPR